MVTINHFPVVQINDRYEFPLQLDLDRENGKYLSPDADRSVRNLYTLHRFGAWCLFLMTFQIMKTSIQLFCVVIIAITTINLFEGICTLYEIGSRIRYWHILNGISM